MFGVDWDYYTSKLKGKQNVTQNISVSKTLQSWNQNSRWHVLKPETTKGLKQAKRPKQNGQNETTETTERSKIISK